MARMCSEMSPKEFKERVRQVIAEESAEPERWFYCSFADDVKDGFRGAVILKTHGVGTAGALTAAMGINPGGQMAAWELPDEIIAQVPEEMRNKLLTKSDVKSIWPDAATIREHEESDREASK